MTRPQLWISASIFATAFVTLLIIPQTPKAQQQNTCADRARQRQAVTLARQINSVEINARPRTANRYQPISAFPQISVPEGFTAQLIINVAGTEYVFSVK